MQLHIEESFSTSTSILNIFAYRIIRKDQITNYNLEHIFRVVIAYAKWRMSFLCKQKKNLKVVCDCSTAVAMDVLNVLLNILI